jgi:hypothetical protein
MHRVSISMTAPIEAGTTPLGSNKFISSVVSAASQGAAGAIIGATLASVTDPITNRVLVKRMTVSQAISEVNSDQMLKYFKTTLPTNFIKFPLFEVLNEVITSLNVPASLKGVVSGAIFTTATLPLTNYRYCKSVQEDISLRSPKLWKAYVPTLVRDIVYANSRNQIAGLIAQVFPHLSKTTRGRIVAMFVTVVAACIISSPGNEWRGYTLQPVDKRKPVGEFFQFERYLRSTLIGALVMGLSLGIATVVGPPVQRLLPLLTDKRIMTAALVLALTYEYNRVRKD